MKLKTFLIWSAWALVVFGYSARGFACPFCDAATQTLSEEMQSADAAVLAKLIKEAPPDAEAGDPKAGVATFEIVEALHGQQKLGDLKQIEVVFFGEAEHERLFLITGLGTEKLDWTTPLPLSPAAVEYLRKLPELPSGGADRLAFFQDFLEHEDPLLAQDAYDEFGRAPYEDVKALAPRMDHDQLVKWVADLDINPSRRRLYLTMLGVCGTKDDLPLLESMIVSDFEAMEPHLNTLVGNGLAVGGPVGLPALLEIVQQEERRKKLGLDALVACYLVLRGPDGLDLIDDRFLKNPSAEYTYIYSTIMALRFHGDQETGILPRERLLQSMRLLLANPDFADQVVLDLSRWEDWSVMDRLVEMFKSSDKQGYIRQPVVTYLTVASEQPGKVGESAKAALSELEGIDPETVKQARTMMAFGALGRARGRDAATESPDSAKPAAETAAFAASAADRATDTADMPDPAAYAESASSADSASVTDSPAGGDGKSQNVSDATLNVLPREATPPAVNPVLVIGVPRGAALILMGIYWLVLRAGAV